MEKQDTIHSLLVAHSKTERVKGREIYPAFRIEAFSEAGKQDDDREFEAAFPSDAPSTDKGTL